VLRLIYVPLLLMHFKSYEGVYGNTVYQKQEYGEKQSEINAALMEAWNWLEREPANERNRHGEGAERFDTGND
jgi:hypothetical protein